MATLYDLTEAYNDLLDAVMGAEAGDDIPGLMARLDEIGEAWDTKADNYAKLLRETESLAEMAKAEADRLTARRKRLEALGESLRARMKDAMKQRGLGAVETSIGTWKLGKGRESVQIIDPAKVPDEYLIYPAPTVSKTAIMAAYKATGEIIPGTEIVRNESFGLR